jgi:hypothetical protein
MARFLNLAVISSVFLTAVAWDEDTADDDEIDQAESWTPYGNEEAPENEVQHIITPVFKEDEYDFFGEARQPNVLRFGVPGLMLSAASYVTVAVIKFQARESSDVDDEVEWKNANGIKNYDV